MILTLVNFFLRESAYVQKLSLSLLYVTSYGMTITSHNKGLLESQGVRRQHSIEYVQINLVTQEVYYPIHKSEYHTDDEFV
jgi:hypothetical protein